MLYIGVDISKYKHDCIVINDAGVIIRNVFSFDNSRTGFDQFMEMYRFLDPLEIKKIGFDLIMELKDLKCENYNINIDEYDISSPAGA